MDSWHTEVVKIKPNWLPPFRLTYDGKYVSLYGRDKNYPVLGYGSTEKKEYEEILLVPIVIEVRKCRAEITKISNTEIEIELFTH